MGSGKTSLGREAARILGWQFCDLDEELDQAAGMSISEIFDQHGEAFFRSCESETLASVIANRPAPVIIATGGGTPCHGDNLAAMQAAGEVIFLEVNSDELARRLLSENKQRPMIAGIAPADLPDQIELLLLARRECYGRADRILSGDRLSAQNLADFIRS